MIILALHSCAPERLKPLPLRTILRRKIGRRKPACKRQRDARPVCIGYRIPGGVARAALGDHVVPEDTFEHEAEPLGGAQKDYDATAANVKAAILKEIAALQSLKTGELLEGRYAKFRKIGVVSHAEPVKRSRAAKSAPAAAQ